MIARTILAVLVALFFLGSAYRAPVLGASKKGTLPPVLLSQEYLRASMQGFSGIALDLNGDGNDDLVVGAPYANHKHASGALLVYFATPKGLFPSRPSAVIEGNGTLGWSLAALGDVNGDGKGDFAAGAVNGDGEKVSLSGTVTIYRSGEKPQILEGENALDRFGYVLASGDLNGDGKADLIVGSPLHSPSPQLYQQGAVYVYFGPSYVSSIKISSNAANSGIGFTLATGDINGDGVDDLLMGATGKVIGYYGGDTFPSEAPALEIKNSDSYFGRTIAVLWDIDQDGYNDLAVGAYQAVVGGVTDTGRLFIVKGSGGSQERIVNANDPASEDLLARIDGELNCGRFASAILPIKDVKWGNVLAVSAVHADGNPWPMTGKIFLFTEGDLAAGASVESVTAIPGESRDMHLGTFLAQVKGSWGNWLAAGAPTEKTNTGRVRLFALP
jgi:hypothetical protein